jgi:tetratricopeptide (TPR) repeat protein
VPVTTLPCDAKTWNNKGLSWAALGRYKEALEAFQKALEIEPNYADARNNKGAAQARIVE